MLVGLLGANGMGHGAVCACGGVLVAGLALMCRLLLLLLLLQQVVLPVKLLPLRVHDVGATSKDECVGRRVFEQESWASGEDQINTRSSNAHCMEETENRVVSLTD